MLNSEIFKSNKYLKSFRFKTNADRFEIEYAVGKISRKLSQFVGASTRAGISIMYKHLNDKYWSNIGSFSYHSPQIVDMSNFIQKGEYYEILVYSPIFSRLSKLAVKIPDDCSASLIDTPSDRSIVVAGGPHSHGTGCTTVNNMFSNILERNLDADVYHITYDRGVYLELIKKFYETNPPKTNVGILELDYYPLKGKYLKKELPQVIELMSKNCEHVIGWYTIPNPKSYKKITTNNIIKKFIYDDKIDVVDLSYIYNEEYSSMCVYNNWSINDTANILIYRKLHDEIRRLTKWNI